jgi:Mce-associated membrane protein
VILYVQLDASSESRCACAGDGPGPVTDSDADPATTEAPASLAEAEDELSRAEARAEAARARAAELRRQAEDGAGEAKPSKAKSHWSSRLPRPTRKKVGVGTAIVLIAASLGASGYFAWQHYALAREQRHAAEFAAAARQGVATLMSLDADHAMESVQRTIDVTTGALKSQLESTSSYVAKNAQDAKVTTKATVQDVAVESMTDNSAVVLVVAKSDTTNPDKSKRPPVFWRLSVNIDRDAGQLKLSKLDFVQ